MKNEECRNLYFKNIRYAGWPLRSGYPGHSMKCPRRTRENNEWKKWDSRYSWNSLRWCGQCHSSKCLCNHTNRVRHLFTADMAHRANDASSRGDTYCHDQHHTGVYRIHMRVIWKGYHRKNCHSWIRRPNLVRRPSYPSLLLESGKNETVGRKTHLVLFSPHEYRRRYWTYETENTFYF